MDSLYFLRAALLELLGFSTIVPELVDRERTRRFDAIFRALDNQNRDDALAMYEAESGEEEGQGHADFDRVAFSASITLAYELLRDFLVSELSAWANQQGTLSRQTERGLNHGTMKYVVESYRRKLKLDLMSLPDWSAIDEIRLTRNAVIHNRGRYSWDYIRAARPPRFPVAIDMTLRANEMGDDAIVSAFEHLINLTDIPLTARYVRDSADRILSFASEVRSRIGPSKRLRAKPIRPSLGDLSEAISAFRVRLLEDGTAHPEGLP